jgi:hypothetical protein
MNNRYTRLRQLTRRSITVPSWHRKHGLDEDGAKSPWNPKQVHNTKKFQQLISSCLIIKYTRVCMLDSLPFSQIPMQMHHKDMLKIIMV